MRRRQLLTLPTLGVSTSLVSASKTAHTQASALQKPQRILVIGAGLAGLAAATQLQQHGHDVQVLEARERTGGRIWTGRQWPDMPLDFGATWIHGIKGNPLTDLANAISAHRVTTFYDRAVTYQPSGQPITAEHDQQLDRLRKQIHQALKTAQKTAPDQSIQQAIAPVLAAHAGDAQARRFIQFIVSSEFETEYAGSANRLSAHWFDNTKEFGGADALLTRGFQTLTDHLAQPLTIHLGQVVQAIHWQASPLQVITQKGVFVADKVVVTLPLGVLQGAKVQFHPPLPPAKHHAIAQLGMGLLNKCYLRFQKAFWPADVDWLEYIPTHHGHWTEWVSFQRAVQWPVLLGFHAGDRAHDMEAWSDQQIVDDAMHTLRPIFGAQTPDPIDFQITRWGSDPFAMGSYSYNAVGATPKMRQDLAMPLSRALYFAGEATEKDYFGTAHGAYLSGLRAAHEVLSG